MRWVWRERRFIKARAFSCVGMQIGRVLLCPMSIANCDCDVSSDK